MKTNRNFTEPKKVLYEQVQKSSEDVKDEE